MVNIPAVNFLYFEYVLEHLSSAAAVALSAWYIPLSRMTGWLGKLKNKQHQKLKFVLLWKDKSKTTKRALNYVSGFWLQ